MDRPADMVVLPVEGGVPPSAVVRVNRAANLLAVSTATGALAVLADTLGADLLSQPLPAPLLRCGISRSSGIW